METTAHRTTRMRKRSRTIPIKGSWNKGNDDTCNNLYHCGFCGFRCDVRVNALGGRDSLSGANYTDAVIPSHGLADSTDIRHSISKFRGSMIALEIGADGNPKPIEHLIQRNTGTGCPLCGSLNWRGDY